VRYGITSQEYAVWFVMQDGSCGSCGKSGERLVVDHDHETGKIRGLLCQACNKGIGLLGDGIEGVWMALQYLHRVEARTELLTSSRAADAPAGQ
jgi:Autographiviridae endonuclease VII